MRTTNEFVKYCILNDTAAGFKEKWLQKNFKLIENNLLDNEEGKIAFVGLKDKKSNSAFLITDKRILIGQKKLFGEKIESLKLKKINKMSINIGKILATLDFDASSKDFTVGIPKDDGQKLYNLIAKNTRIRR